MRKHNSLILLVIFTIFLVNISNTYALYSTVESDFNFDIRIDDEFVFLTQYGFGMSYDYIDFGLYENQSFYTSNEGLGYNRYVLNNLVRNSTEATLTFETSDNITNTPSYTNASHFSEPNEYIVYINETFATFMMESFKPNDFDARTFSGERIVEYFFLVSQVEQLIQLANSMSTERIPSNASTFSGNVNLVQFAKDQSESYEILEDTNTSVKLGTDHTCDFTRNYTQHLNATNVELNPINDPGNILNATLKISVYLTCDAIMNAFEVASTSQIFFNYTMSMNIKNETSGEYFNYFDFSVQFDNSRQLVYESRPATTVTTTNTKTKTTTTTNTTNTDDFVVLPFALENMNTLVIVILAAASSIIIFASIKMNKGNNKKTFKKR